MNPRRREHLSLVGEEPSDMIPQQTRFFIEVAANPQAALDKLKQTAPELAADIAKRQERAAAANRKANVSRFAGRIIGT